MSRRQAVGFCFLVFVLTFGLIVGGFSLAAASSAGAADDKTPGEVVYEAESHGGAEAAGHGGISSEKFWDFIWRTMNFVVFAIILFILIRKPASQFFSSRKEEISRALDDLEKKKAEAEVRFRELEGKLTDMMAEREKIIAEYVKEGEEEREKIVANAKDMADRIKKQAEAAIDLEIRSAKADLVAEIANMSASMAEDLIRKNINEEDQVRLVEESLKTI